ncbi:MAG TPA: response regulator transcription factor [Mycobacteriales bacterium]
MIQVAIVDGCLVFAQALAARLGTESDVRVVRCATGPAALRQSLAHSSADVVVADAALFGPDQLAAEAPTAGESRWAAPGGVRPTPPTQLRPIPPAQLGPAEPGRLRSGHSPAVVLLADAPDLPRVGAAVRSGIRGWVPRDASFGDLLHAVRAAADGGTWVPPRVLTAVLDELTWRPPDDDPTRVLLARLTPREKDVLDCLADGLGRPEVAARLHVSTNTVRTHVQSILSKLGVNSSVAAVAQLRRATHDPPPWPMP